MPDGNNRTTEGELSWVVLKILYESSTGEMSIHDLVREIPQHTKLTPEDQEPSQTREGEEMWEQRVRNIQSHHETTGNYIAEGFLEHIKGGLRITETGRLHFQHNS